jgi:hypothetical protein
MQVSSALDAIKEWGTFKAYKEAHEAYVEQKSCEASKGGSSPPTAGSH